MTVERLGEPVWNVTLEGTNLQVEGLTLDLEALSGPEPRVIQIYADATGAPTLTPTDWLGAEVECPGRSWRWVGGEEGGHVEMEPLSLERVRVRLFGVPRMNSGMEVLL